VKNQIEGRCGEFALTVLSLSSAGHIGKFIGNIYCMKYVTLSCIMNKVPEDIVDANLQRNPAMKDVFNSSTMS